MAQPFFYYTNTRIAAIPAAGGAITDLTKSFDENPGPIAWLKDGILFSASQKTAAHLFRLDPATQAVKQITPGTQWIFSSFSLHARRQRAGVHPHRPEGVPRGLDACRR